MNPRTHTTAAAAGTTVAIIPGFGEGSWHTNHLLTAFEKLGYVAEANPTRASLIVAHSGGCFFLPADATASQKVVLIGPPFWPGRPVWRSFLRKVTGDFWACLRRGKLGFWVAKTLWSGSYIITSPARTIHISQSSGRHDFHHAMTAQETIVIRNSHDSFCTPEIAALLLHRRGFIFSELPGQHDDCWLDAEEHARLVVSLTTQR